MLEHTEYKFRSKTTSIAYGSHNFENTIEVMSQPLPKKCTPYQIKLRYHIAKTGKPVCTFNGIVNPVKLNIDEIKKKVKR